MIENSQCSGKKKVFVIGEGVVKKENLSNRKSDRKSAGFCVDWRGSGKKRKIYQIENLIENLVDQKDRFKTFFKSYFVFFKKVVPSTSYFFRLYKKSLKKVNILGHLGHFLRLEREW